MLHWVGGVMWTDYRMHKRKLRVAPWATKGSLQTNQERITETDCLIHF